MLEGERNQTMSLTGIGKPNEGDYTCLVTNEAGFGSATSVLTGSSVSLSSVTGHMYITYAVHWGVLVPSHSHAF